MDSSPLPPSSFGALVRRYRLAAGLSQEALARYARLSADTIGALEHGRRSRPRQETLRLLGDALALSPRERALFVAAAHLDSAGRESAAPDDEPTPPGAGSPFVGRGQEMAYLRRFLEGTARGAAAGMPTLLVFRGEPGIGASRLLSEAATLAARRGWTVLAAQCQRRGGQEPLAPLIEALAGHLRAHDPLQLRAALAGCAWLARLLPELAAYPVEPLPAWTVTPDQERRLVEHAVACFLANVAGPTGTLLVVDNLHWAEPAALDLLAALLRRRPRTPLCVVGAYRDTAVRPGEPLSVLLAELARAGLALSLPVGPLAPDEAATLLAGLVRDGTLEGSRERDARRELVLRRSDGVPSFLTGYARQIDSGEADAVQGVPPPIAQETRERIATLPLLAQDLLAAVAVMGCPAPVPVLAAVAGHAERTILAALETARAARLLERGEPTGATYCFAHEIQRAVVEEDLGPARRRFLHRALAHALEEGGGSLQGREPVDHIAAHYAWTEEHEKALYWLERAGDRALATGAPATAAAHYGAAGDRARAAGAPAAVCARLDEKLGEVLLAGGDPASAQQHFARARVLTADAAGRAGLRAKEGLTWAQRWEAGRALALFDAAESEGSDGAMGTGLPRRVQVALLLGRAEAHARQWDLQAAEAAAERAVALLGPQGCAGGDASAGAWRSQDEELRHAETLLSQSLARRAPSQEALESALCWSSLGHLAAARGEPHGAERCYRQSVLALERVGDQHAVARAWRDLGRVVLLQGDALAAEECFRRSLALSIDLGDAPGSAETWYRLGRAALSRGDLAGAEAHFARSLTLCEQAGDQAGMAWVWSGCAEVACQEGSMAVTVAEQCGAPGLAQAIAVVASSAATPARQSGLGGRRRRLAVLALLLEHARALVTEHGVATLSLDVTLLAAAAHLCQGRGAAVRAAWEAAQVLAVGGRDMQGSEQRLRLALGALHGLDGLLSAVRADLLPVAVVGAAREHASLRQGVRVLLRDIHADLLHCGALRALRVAGVLSPDEPRLGHERT